MTRMTHLSAELGALPVTLADVEAARELLEGVVRRTPVEPNRALAERVGGPVSLKCENLQRAGLVQDPRGLRADRAAHAARSARAGVVAASAGNHAQGVALAGQLLGTRVDGLHAGRRPAAEGRGDARVRRRGAVRTGSVDEALVARAGVRRARPARSSSTPSTTPTSSPGRARSAWRSSSSARTCAPIVVGTGGGGLLAGHRGRREGAAPGRRVVGVQAEGAAAYPASLAAGRPVRARAR